jgi:hypothetical protein
MRIGQSELAIAGLGDSLVLTVMGQIAFMPILVLSARLCPPGIEATLFALLMSVFNLSGLVSTEFGAILTHWLGISEFKFENLWILVVIANLSTLLPLTLLGWLPKEDPQQGFSNRAQSLPPVELYEHHTPGSLADPSMIPELMPEFFPAPDTISPS